MFKSIIIPSLLLSSMAAGSGVASVPSNESLVNNPEPIKKKVKYFECLIKSQESSSSPSKKSTDEKWQELNAIAEANVKGFRGTLENISTFKENSDPTPTRKGLSSYNLTTDIQTYQDYKKLKVDPLFKNIKEQFSTFKETQTTLFEEFAKLLPQTLHDASRQEAALSELEARKKVLMAFIDDFEKGLNKEFINLTVELAKPHLSPQAAIEQIKHLAFLSENWLKELDTLTSHALKSQWSKDEPKISHTSGIPRADITHGFDKDVEQAKLEAKIEKEKAKNNGLTKAKKAVRGKIKSFSSSPKNDHPKT